MFCADGPGPTVYAIDLFGCLVFEARGGVLIVNSVAFELVMDDFARDGGAGGALDLVDEFGSDRSGAHVAARRALPCEILAVVNVYLEVEAERAGPAKQFDAKEGARRPRANDADCIT